MNKVWIISDMPIGALSRWVLKKLNPLYLKLKWLPKYFKLMG